MSEGFKIDGPGFYRQRDGGKAEVLAIRGERAYGTIEGNISAFRWSLDGTSACIKSADLVDPWSDPPATLNWQNAGIGLWRSNEFTIEIDKDGCFQSRFCTAPFKHTTTTFEEAKILCRWKTDELKAAAKQMEAKRQTPPATPWTQADVPWPCLMRHDNVGSMLALAQACIDGLLLAVGSIIKYPKLVECNWQWSPDNVTWHACTREAVAAWRQSRKVGM